MTHDTLHSPPTRTHKFFIPALDCPEEFVLIEKGLAELGGIRDTRPDYFDRSLRVEFDPAVVDVEEIEGQLRHIGFPSQPSQAPEYRSGAPVPPRISIHWSTVVAGVLLVAAGMMFLAGIPAPIYAGLLIGATITAGWHVVAAAWRALKLKAIDMNVLMTIAALGAVATGELFEAATAMFLFSVSLWLERYTLGRARHAVQSLVQLKPATAHRLCHHPAPREAHAGDHDACGHSEHHHVTEIHPTEIRKHDLLLVKPGERVPVDGVVTSGNSHVNEAPITGESLPVPKTSGDSLFAGALNGEGTLEMRATTTADDSTLANVARLVEQAQAARSPTERFVDQFARRYTPAVVAIALLIAFGPPLLTWAGVTWFAANPAVEWLHRGLVLLVIACPCALVISTPVTILCGLHQATRYGLLVKGGEFLEWAAKTRCIAFDKTGTLTEGRPRLVEIRGLHPTSPQEVLRIAAALEAGSEHPLAAAIISAAHENGFQPQRAQEVMTSRGAGVEGRVDGRACFVGSIAYALQLTGLSTLPSELAGSPAGATPAVVGCDGQLIGALYLADKARSDAAAAIAELRAMHVDTVVMLTGDSDATAERIGKELGIDQVRAELLPQGKVDAVQQLVAQFDAVAMVGDGVNDAPALAAARIGIALGVQASDTALETADVVSLSPHLRRVPEFIRLGRRTRDILAQNIAFSLTIKLGVLLMALLGFGTLWAAVMADVGASMLVVFNGMRLLQPVDLRVTGDRWPSDRR